MGAFLEIFPSFVSEFISSQYLIFVISIGAIVLACQRIFILFDHCSYKSKEDGSVDAFKITSALPPG